VTFNNNITSPYLPTSVVLPKDLEPLIVKLTSLLTEMSLKLNQRTLGNFTTAETGTGETWLQNNTAFRQVYTFGAIAAGATLNIPHNLTNIAQFTHMYGTCITDTPDYRPIPMASTVNVTNQISLRVLGPNIVVTNGATAPNITSGLIVLEYLKN